MSRRRMSTMPRSTSFHASLHNLVTQHMQHFRTACVSLCESSLGAFFGVCTQLENVLAWLVAWLLACFVGSKGIVTDW